jgi:hypothetical protein
MSELNDILSLCATRDWVAGIEHIARQPASVNPAKIFLEVMRHYYWKLKDLPAAIAFGQAGAHFALFSAIRSEATDAALSHQLRSTAKGLYYDLASFTWPGWDEPGIKISAGDLAVGLDAARTNLRLSHELNKGDLALSRAFWMLAGHEMCTGDFDAARQSYHNAARHAHAAGSKPEQFLAEGFVRLTELLDAKTTGADPELDSILDRLKSLENGPDFVQQILTARAVFNRRQAP